MADPIPSGWLRYDYQGALAGDDKAEIAALRETWCLPPHILESLRDALDIARQRALNDLILVRYGRSPDESASKREALDAGFIDQPELLLDEYKQKGEQSELGRIERVAAYLRDEVDRVVLLGIGGSSMGARALFEALGDGYHNERSRAEREGVPRLYFAGNNFDNDGLSSLIELLEIHATNPGKAEDRWAVLVASKSGGTLETSTAFRIVLRAAESYYAGHNDLLKRLVVPITGAAGKLRELAESFGCSEVFTVPEDIGGRFSIFTPVALLPAAILGIDLVALLEGASVMTKRFRAQPAGDNPVLDYVGIAHALEQQRGATNRVLSVWSSQLEATGLWYDQLLAESLGKGEHGATPITAVNTRDLHSRGQQHQDGRRDKLITNVVVRRSKRAPLRIGPSRYDQDLLNRFEHEEIPDLLSAAWKGTNRAYWEAARPTTDILLPQLDEFTMGQLFQMLMLATVVEGRLIDVNPYGQPGVEAYKRHMNAILDERAQDL